MKIRNKAKSVVCIANMPAFQPLEEREVTPNQITLLLKNFNFEIVKKKIVNSKK